MGKVITGLTAQAKGQCLAIYTPRRAAERAEVRAEWQALGAEVVGFMGRTVPCFRTQKGLRALAGTSLVTPETARKY